MKNIVIRVFHSKQRDSRDFLESESLANSWGTLKDLEFPYEYFDETQKRHHEGLAKKLKSEFYELLDAIDGETALLILPLIMKDEVAFYIASREDSDTRVLSWQVVYNNFSRFSFLERHREIWNSIPEDTKKWIHQLEDKYGLDYILKVFEGNQIDIAVLGESIIDEYVFCEALGKVSKDPILAFQIGERDAQIGGILAVANHVARLNHSCTLFSEINSLDEEFVKRHLDPYVDSRLVISEKTSMVTKTRYIDVGTNSKIFETYSVERSEFKKEDLVSTFVSMRALSQFSNLLIVDYGHGLLSNENIASLLDSGLDVTVNAQSNAGNRGFNPISRYRGAARIFINGSELELQARRKSENKVDLVAEIAPSLECKELYVSQGAAGLLAWDKEGGIISVPGFAPTVRDRIGAGDALLSTVNYLRAREIPMDLSMFYGNIAGALMVGVVGNSLTVSRSLLINNAEKILRNVTSI